MCQLKLNQGVKARSSSSELFQSDPSNWNENFQQPIDLSSNLASASYTARVKNTLGTYPEKTKAERIHLYEMDHWCCSVIGTCLTHDDLLAIGRRHKLTIETYATAFDVHGFFVEKAGQKCAISRTIEKRLDARYSGLLKRIAKIRDKQQLMNFWNEAVSNGFVAGAYWAMVSHAHVPLELRNRVFGEVHMMSHLMGGSARKIVGAAAELQRRFEDLEERHLRMAVHTKQALEERDAEIARLRQALSEAVARTDSESQYSELARSDAADRTHRLLLKRERALIASRTKTRELERELKALRSKPRRLQRLRGASTTNAKPSVDNRRSELVGKAILYLGGRTGAIAQMQKLAKDWDIELLHHDGGLEQSAHLICDMVEKCDAVICPVTCINHQACQKAKYLCKNRDKPFIPINSAGKSALARALDSLSIELKR